MIIQTEVSWQNFDLPSLLQRFEQQESYLTGSIVIHRGKVKSPGKKVIHLSSVMLKERLEGSGQQELAKIADEAAAKFPHLQQIYINHRLGEAKVGDDILLLIVSAADRRSAFSAAQWIVDEIKKEKIITLTEIA